MAETQLAQEARSELLSVSLIPSVGALLPTVSLISCSRACVRTCHQVISFLQKHGIRLGMLSVKLYRSDPASYFTPEYHWIEFWRGVLGLLEFLTKKIDELQSAAGIRLLIKEVSTPPATLRFSPDLLQALSLLDLSITTAQAFLPSAKALHEFVVSREVRSLAEHCRSLITYVV